MLAALLASLASAYDRAPAAYAAKSLEHQVIRQRSKAALKRTMQTWESPWQEREDALGRTGVWQEAIDGRTVARPRGEELLVRLRDAAEQRRLDALRAAERRIWRGSIEDAVIDCATDYLEFVREVREAEEYALGGHDGSRVDDTLLRSVSRRFGPSSLLLQVTRHKRAASARALASSRAAEQPPPPFAPLTMEHRWALWRLFRGAVRQLLVDDAVLAKRRDALEWRVLRRMHASAILEQRREGKASAILKQRREGKAPAAPRAPARRGAGGRTRVAGIVACLSSATTEVAEAEAAAKGEAAAEAEAAAAEDERLRRSVGSTFGVCDARSLSWVARIRERLEAAWRPRSEASFGWHVRSLEIA